MRVTLPQLDKQAAAAAGLEIVGFPQFLYTRAFGDPDLLFVPLLELAREAVSFGERSIALGESREQAIMMSGIRLATSLLADSSFSLSARVLTEDNQYIVDVQNETFSLNTRLYATRSRRTSMFGVEVAGKIRQGPYIVRGTGNDSVMVQIQIGDQQLRQPKFFSTLLAEEFLRVKMEQEQAGAYRNIDRAQENADICLTVRVGNRNMPIILRKKEATGNWDVLDRQMCKSIGILSPQTTVHLRELLLALSELIEK